MSLQNTYLQFIVVRLQRLHQVPRLSLDFLGLPLSVLLSLRLPREGRMHFRGEGGGQVLERSDRVREVIVAGLEDR